MNQNQRDRIILNRLGRVFDLLDLWPRVFTMTLLVGPVKNRDGSIATNQEFGKMRQQQTVTISINPDTIVDDRGYKAHLDGTPQWSSTDESIVGFTVSEDGMSVTAESFDLEGVVAIAATADGALGDDVLTITGTAALSVASGNAVSFDLTVSEPQDKATTPTEPTDEQPPTE